VDASGTSVLTYDHANRLAVASRTDGLLAGIIVTNHFQAPNGRDSVGVLGLSEPLRHDYAYDAYGRLGPVSAGTCSATYGYLPDSDLLRTTTCKNDGTSVLTTTRSWEYGMRLGAIVNEANGTIVSSHAYHYDRLNRRTQASLEDGSIWKYDYNDRDELTGARRYWPDWAPVTGQHFAYDYDNIGNRKTASAGGDVNGGSLRQTTYTANGLNQYTDITTPGYKDICGIAIATNGVTVNGGAADRKVEYFHREIGIANGSGALWQDVPVTSGGATDTGGLVFPANNQTLAYDADGNLSFDGVWTYEWDGENRLIAMTMTNVANIAPTNRLRLEFAYDFQGRRVQKKVSHWDSNGWVLDSNSRFVYDGWNLLTVFNSSLSLHTSFMWGLDLSGTMDQAGGIGGLLLAVFYGTSTTSCFAGYDGSGNVTALLDSSGQPVLARYEYGPFGETIRITGPVASTNPFRFSTKYSDDETHLVYYGFRYYSSTFGRWINRDPITDQLILNLYLFCHNSSTCRIDTDGRFDLISVLTSSYVQGALKQGYINAGINGALAAVQKLFLNQGTWGDVMKSALQGFSLGLLTGPVVNISNSFQEAIGFGKGMVGTEFASGFLKGLRGLGSMGLGAGINSTIFGDDRAIENLRNNLWEQMGIGFAVGVMAGMTKSGIQETGAWGPDDLILTFAIDAAARLGVDAAESMWSTATQVSDLFD